MKAICQLRINNAFVNLLPKRIIGDNVGPVTIIKIEVGSPEYNLIHQIALKVFSEKSESFFYGWGITRSYSKSELANASLFHLEIKYVFEPTGEECGTTYDESQACEICGANRKQVGSLVLKKGCIPKKDIAKTIGGEIVVSEKFVDVINKRNIKGARFKPINIERYFQFESTSKIELSTNTIVGINPFDLSTRSENEVYKCPNGHTLGLNLISEVHVLSSPLIGEIDFLSSSQMVGVRRGYLQPEPIYFVSPDIKKIIEEEKLTGFEFHIANID